MCPDLLILALGCSHKPGLFLLHEGQPAVQLHHLRLQDLQGAHILGAVAGWWTLRC